MKTQFTPIAMRFKKKNWESIKDKIEAAGIGHHIWGDSRQCYLTNHWSESKETGIPFIGNHSNDHSNLKLVSKVYETWDEAIFLRACGIEVDTYTVSKEFILEGYKVACSTWKAKIEAQFPELFPKFEVGKWYIWKNTRDVLLFITNFQGDKVKGYGIDNGLWFDVRGTSNYWGCKNDNSFEPATKEEVEKALIAEAKKRGFKGGVVCNCIDIKKNNKIVNHSYFVYNSIYNYMYCGGVRIFDNGKWAEITSEPIEVTLE